MLEVCLIRAATRGNGRGAENEKRLDQLVSSEKKLWTHRLLHVGQPADPVAAKKTCRAEEQ